MTKNWQDQARNPRDAESYRNAYWQFLAAGSGGVHGFDWSRDWMDHRETSPYRDLVQYKAVLCYAQFNDANQTMFQQFRPVRAQDRFVWLTPYQYRGGNYFQVGGSSMESFLEAVAQLHGAHHFRCPGNVIFWTGTSYIVGFGQNGNPTVAWCRVGRPMYPYATAGITALDWTSPATKNIYGRTLRHVTTGSPIAWGSRA